MRRIVLISVCTLLIPFASALAQSGGGGSGGGGGSTGSGAAAAVGSATTSGGTAATRPGTAATPGIAPGAPAPGVGNTPTDPQHNNVDANPSTNRLPGTTANAPNGSMGSGGAALSPGADQTPGSSGRPQPGGANSSPNSTRTGKNPTQEALADCMRLWDSGTHMTKGEWSATCRRIQGRLDSLKLDPVTPLTASKRQRAAQRRNE